ncbi:hypothetical protein [Streptantibioticus ferralitis]|uniref:Uncharacterized protein n=1 Tax=Streptantibioticus ferralitis TaxID=236510 RepID=A0ABT5ZB96_9ACTN|nr:hypothetical protein [Streptantibioticus ferralitis]MDF2260821.1 hypothetical protein [Streptantibioticus ferralitis]
MTEHPLTVVPRNELPRRMGIARRTRRLLPDEVAEAQRERWAQTPDQVWFRPWVPLPPEVPRGPYKRPTRALVLEIEAGLRSVLGDDQ